MKSHNLSLDLRSLALFRIAIALLLLADLWQRSHNLVAHYSDWGVLPRSALQQIYGATTWLSPYQWNGSPLFTFSLFALTALAYLALLVGFKTRWATFFSWGLLLALQNRNPLLGDIGDLIGRLMLFWALFLPLGARFSLDQALLKSHSALRIADSTQRVFSYATIAFILQLGFIYFFSALLKSRPSWIIDHTAIYYALRVDIFSTPLGTWLTGYPQFLKLLTPVVFYFELLGPMLLLFLSARTWPRTLLVLVFIAFHIGLGLFLSTTLLSCFSIVAWLPLFPSAFWNGLKSWRWFRLRQTLCVYYDADCAFCRHLTFLLCELLCLPASWNRSAQTDPQIQSEIKKHELFMVIDEQGKQWSGFRALLVLLETRSIFDALRLLLRRPLPLRIGEAFCRFVARRQVALSRFAASLRGQRPRLRLSWFEQGAVIACLIYITLWNVYNLEPRRFGRIFPSQLRTLALAMGINQRWGMFAPPTTKDGWMVVEAQQRDGKKVDPFREATPVSWQKPAFVSTVYPDSRWRKYVEGIASRARVRSTYRLYFARFLRQRWNQSHSPDQQILSMRIYYLEETNLLDGTNTPPRKILLASYNYPKG